MDLMNHPSLVIPRYEESEVVLIRFFAALGMTDDELTNSAASLTMNAEGSTINAAEHLTARAEDLTMNAERLTTKTEDLM